MKANSTFRNYGTIALAICALFMTGCQSSKETKRQFEYSVNWDFTPVQHSCFVDLGKYVLYNDSVNYENFSQYNEYLAKRAQAKAGCTATIKRNSKGEVIVGRNMDIEVSQMPAIISIIRGGKYQTLSLNYSGTSLGYTYAQVDSLDNYPEFVQALAFCASDALNEVGLYIEANLREENEGLICTGTNPGKERVSFISLVSLVAANCATVDEVLAYLADSYDWFTPYFSAGGDDVGTFNLGYLVGDAKGNYGLIEFAENTFKYIPYSIGHANYYMHPEFAEKSRRGSGYGRLGAALPGLTDCETEKDMMENMKHSMWGQEIEHPGCLGYSDIILDINERCKLSNEAKQAIAEKELYPYQNTIKEYKNGNEDPLRNQAAVWTTSFNIGANCATKHLILRLWEKDDAIFECQWK